MLDRRHSSGSPAPPPCNGSHLLLRQPRHKTQWGKHLHMLFVNGRDLAARLLAGLGYMEMQPKLQVFAELQILPGASSRIAVAGDRPGLHRGGAAADCTLDAVLDHKIQPAGVGADNRLPAFDRAEDRT